MSMDEKSSVSGSVIPSPDALLSRQIELLERSLKASDEENKRSLKAADEENKRCLAMVQSELEALREAHKTPWYKDRRFWAGISTVPMLLLGGWLIKTMSGDAAALRLLHKAFGTEPALSSALKDDTSDFTKQLEMTIGKGLQSKTGVLSGALDGSLKDKLVLTEGNLVETLSKELREYVGGRHASFQSVGLVDPSQARSIACGAKWCVDARAGQTRSATIVFAASPGKKVDVDLGINVRQYKLDASGRIDPAGSEDVTAKVKLSELLVFKLDDGDKLALSPSTGQNQRYTLDGITYAFDQFSIKGRTVGPQPFPMRSLSLEVAPGVPSDYVFHVATVISQVN